ADDLAECDVAGVRARGVQARVVGDVDEELRSGGVGVVGARHRDRARLVLHAGGALMGDRRARDLLVVVGVVAAALDHEVADDTVEDRAVVVLGLDVRQEVLDRLGRLVGVHLDDEFAQRGRELDAWCLVGGEGGRAGERKAGGKDEGRGTAGDLHRWLLLFGKKANASLRVARAAGARARAWKARWRWRGRSAAPLHTTGRRALRTRPPGSRARSRSWGWRARRLRARRGPCRIRSAVRTARQGWCRARPGAARMKCNARCGGVARWG